MKSPCRSPRPASGYTLVEVLVAMSILALVVGAASRLSLSQSQSEELIGRESHAVNFAENIARLWQLGVDNPSSILTASPNSDGTLMSYTIDSNLASAGIQPPANVNGGDEYGQYPIQVDRTWVTVSWVPGGTTSTSNIEFSIVRPKADRR